MENKNDKPGVAIKPPYLYFISIALSLLLQWLLPLKLPFGAVGTAVGMSLIVFGAVLAIWAGQTFREAGTHVNPDFPATAIVCSGPYRYTRNPMYLALSLALMSIGLAFNTAWPLIALGPTIIMMNHLVIDREEKYLEAKFGEVYLRYKTSARRWI